MTKKICDFVTVTPQNCKIKEREDRGKINQKYSLEKKTLVF